MKRIAYATLMLACCVAAGAPARAETRSFILPANDGYGIADCLAEGAACGRIVADAWCRAQGMRTASSFGPSDPAEVTASITRSAASAARSYVVTCDE